MIIRGQRKSGCQEKKEGVVLVKNHMTKIWGACAPALVVVGLWVDVAMAVQCVSQDLSMSCHRTIQDALAAASPGEDVSVHPGTYAENVSVDTAGVRVVGLGWLPGQAVISPADGTAVSLNAPRATLQNVTVRNGATGVAVTGVGAIISEVRVHNVTTGISILADDVRVINSSVWQTVGAGISAAGAGLVVQSATVQRTGGVCVDVNGDGARVEKSRMVACGSEGVKIMGGAASVLQNEFRVAGSYMIHVVGPGGRIRGNDLEGGRDAAINVLSDVPLVLFNSARSCGSGIDVSCDSCAGGRVEGNVALNTYDCPGFIIEARSAGLRVLNNTSRGSSEEGFSLSGVGMLVRGNRAFDNSFAGFSFYSSSNMRFIENKASRNYGNGIRIYGGVTETKVNRNRAYANGDVDFFNAGIGTILGTGSNRNFFGTVGGP